MQNNYAKFANVLLPVGLVLMAGTNIVDHYYTIPDFVRGFLDGVGMVFLVAGISYAVSKKKNTGV